MRFVYRAVVFLLGGVETKAGERKSGDGKGFDLVGSEIDSKRGRLV